MAYDSSWPTVCAAIIIQEYDPDPSIFREKGKELLADPQCKAGYLLNGPNQDNDASVAQFFLTVMASQRFSVAREVALRYAEFAPAYQLISSNEAANNVNYSFIQKEVGFINSEIPNFSDNLRSDVVFRSLVAACVFAYYDTRDLALSFLANSPLQAPVDSVVSADQATKNPTVLLTCAAAWLADYEGTFRDAVTEQYSAYAWQEVGKALQEQGYLDESGQMTDKAKAGKSGGCYVATAVYGSYDCPEVWTLRRYRDERLLPAPLGRAFVWAYYATSPTLVKLFGGSTAFKGICRRLLDPFVARLNAQGFEATPYKDS